MSVHDGMVLDTVLSAVFWDELPDRADGRVVLADEDGPWDVTEVVDGAISAGWLTENPWKLTDAGTKRLADLWGPDRVPPGKGGIFECYEHGEYVLAPGDLWSSSCCPAVA